MPSDAMIAAARDLVDLCKRKKLTLTTAESCTGGLLAATLTEIPGSSQVIDGAFVSYSNAAKQKMLGADGGHAQDLWFRQPGDRGSDGQGCARPFRRRPCGLHHRHRRTDRRARPESRSGSCISQSFRAAGQLVHRERKFGEIGRSEVRNQSVLQALAMLREIAETEGAKA